MDIQQTDKESLATYVHRFKWEASRCKFNNDTATIRIFLKGLKNAHTIATKVYEKGPQTLSEAIKKLKNSRQHSKYLPHFYPPHQSTLCQVIMIGAFNAKKSVIWRAIAPTYGATTVIITDMSPWTAQIRYCHQVHQHTTGLTGMTGVGDPPLDTTVMPDAHAMMAETDLDSATLDLTPITTAIEVVATRILAEVTPHLSTDLPITASHMTEAPVPTTTIAIHLTADPHLTGTLPVMTADLDINPGDNTTDQPRDLHPLHRHHLGNTRTKDTNKSQLMTHHQNTTAQMTMTANQMMI